MRKRDDNQVFVKELHPNIVRNLKSNFFTLKGKRLYVVDDTLFMKDTYYDKWYDFPLQVLMQGFEK